MNLETRIRSLYSQAAADADACVEAFAELKCGLNEGRIRAAEPDSKSPTGWTVNAWVKQGILLGFRLGRIVEMSFRVEDSTGFDDQPSPGTKPREDSGFQFRDKHTYPLQRIPPDRNVRVVPGGSAIRDGCYMGRGVVAMPPMYVNVGAYVDDGTLIDSHALVGSCAQIGKRCHLSAAAQIGGVLEPVGALPVILEDDVLVGGNCGVYEGTIVGRGAVLAAGTILTGSTPVYDLVRDTIHRRQGDVPLKVPSDAVVVPGARAVTQGRGRELGLSLYTPVVIKYRDEKTETAVRLEELLR